MNPIRLPAAVVVVLLFVFASASSCSAQSVVPAFRIDPEQPGAVVPPSLIGTNALYWIENDREWADGTIPALLTDGGFAVLRYPGGAVAQNFDWRRSAEYVDVSWPEIPADVTPLTTDQLVAFTKEHGMQLFLVMDLTSVDLEGHPMAGPEVTYDKKMRWLADEGAAWALHVQELGGDVAAYELGNEHYLRHVGHAHLSPDEYARRARRVAEAVRGVDPAARFALGGPNRWNTDREDAWWSVVLAEAYPYADYIALHQYYHSFGAAAEKPYPRDAVTDYGRFVADFREGLRGFAERHGFAPHEVLFTYTEWGGRLVTSFDEFAFLVHEALLSFARHGVAATMEWPLRLIDSDRKGALLDGRAPTLAYAVFQAWARHICGNRLVETDPAMLPPGVYGPVVTDGSSVDWLVANKSGRDAVVRLDLRHFDGDTLTITPLSADGAGAAQTRPLDAAATVTLPAESILLVHME